MKGLLALASVAGAVTPVEKVISMMTDMIAKGQKAKQDEVATMETYRQWVHNQDRDLNLEIGASKKEIEKQSAIKQSATANAEALEQQINEKNATQQQTEQSLAAATKQRAEEKANFEKESADLRESVDALDRAVQVISQKQGGIKALPTSFLQTLAVKVPEVSLALAQQPQATKYAYESQSGGVLEMLKKLHKQFKENLYKVETAESNMQHAYNMEKMNMENMIENLKESIAEMQQRAAAENETAAAAGGKLAAEKVALASAQRELADILTTHKVKEKNFATNQEVRTEELAALQEAVKIIGSGAVAGAAEKHLPTLAQTRVSFLQIESSSQTNARVVMNRIKKATMSLYKSKPLVAVQMMELMAAKGPLDKVVGMIKDLITKLEQQAAEEADHKAKCDKRLKANKDLRLKLEAEVNQLESRIEKLKAQIAELAEQIDELTKAEAAQNKAMAEATEVRNKEKAVNEETISEAKGAQSALTQALSVLREFYEKQGSFLQQVPEMKAYKGMGDGKKGVVGMLEVIQSDFARLEADTSATEDQAQGEYDQFMKDTKADTEAKHKLNFQKQMEKDQKEHDLHTNTKKYKVTSKKYDVSLQVFDALKAACVVKKVSYEERVKAREQEMEDLRQALKILNGEA